MDVKLMQRNHDLDDLSLHSVLLSVNDLIIHVEQAQKYIILKCNINPSFSMI